MARVSFGACCDILVGLCKGIDIHATILYSFLCRLYAEHFGCPGADIRLPCLYCGSEQVVCVRLGLVAVVDNHKGVLIRLHGCLVLCDVLQYLYSTRSIIVYHYHENKSLSRSCMRCLFLLKRAPNSFSFSFNLAYSFYFPNCPLLYCSLVLRL